MLKKCMFGLILILFAFSCLTAQETVTVYPVPKINNSSDEAPSIAANRQGDIMVIYRNSVEGAMYYYRKHGTSDWVGPAPIPNQPYGKGWGSDIYNTDVGVTRNGNFHVMWGIIEGSPAGLYYAVFDIVAGTWSAVEYVLPSGQRMEDLSMGVNPKTDDVILSWTWVMGIEKDEFIKVKGADGWEDSKNISNGPIGDTNPKLGFDEDGRTYLVHKTDRLRSGGNPNVDGDWELVIRLHWLDENNHYSTIWKDEVTWNYPGWHFLPSVAGLKGGQGMVAFAWPNRRGYFYVSFDANSNTSEIEFDPTILEDCQIAPCPVIPWYEYHSLILPYVDEYIFTYKSPALSIEMMRFKDGEWQGAPINLCDGYSSTWPYDTYVQPSVGVLSAWADRADDKKVYFSIYDYKKTVVMQPLNFDVVHGQERSFFSSYYLYKLTWENDPLNQENDVTIASFNIYRKAKTTGNYEKIADVPADTFTYVDRDNVSAADNYDYAVSAVDNEGNESGLAVK